MDYVDSLESLSWVCRGICSFVLKLAAASEHLQSYLDRVDRPVAGTTYLALHDLIENIDASHCLDSTSVPPVNAVRNQQTASVSEQDECQCFASMAVFSTVCSWCLLNIWLFIHAFCQCRLVMLAALIVIKTLHCQFLGLLELDPDLEKSPAFIAC